MKIIFVEEYSTQYGHKILTEIIMYNINEIKQRENKKLHVFYYDCSSTLYREKMHGKRDLRKAYGLRNKQEYRKNDSDIIFVLKEHQYLECLYYYNYILLSLYPHYCTVNPKYIFRMTDTVMGARNEEFDLEKVKVAKENTLKEISQLEEELETANNNEEVNTIKEKIKKCEERLERLNARIERVSKYTIHYTYVQTTNTKTPNGKGKVHLYIMIILSIICRPLNKYSQCCLQGQGSRQLQGDNSPTVNTTPQESTNAWVTRKSLEGRKRPNEEEDQDETDSPKKKSKVYNIIEFKQHIITNIKGKRSKRDDHQAGPSNQTRKGRVCKGYNMVIAYWTFIKHDITIKIIIIDRLRIKININTNKKINYKMANKFNKDYSIREEEEEEEEAEYDENDGEEGEIEEFDDNVKLADEKTQLLSVNMFSRNKEAPVEMVDCMFNIGIGLGKNPYFKPKNESLEHGVVCVVYKEKDTDLVQSNLSQIGSRFGHVFRKKETDLINKELFTVRVSLKITLTANINNITQICEALDANDITPMDVQKSVEAIGYSVVNVTHSMPKGNGLASIHNINNEPKLDEFSKTVKSEIRRISEFKVSKNSIGLDLHYSEISYKFYLISIGFFIHVREARDAIKLHKRINIEVGGRKVRCSVTENSMCGRGQAIVRASRIPERAAVREINDFLDNLAESKGVEDEKMGWYFARAEEGGIIPSVIHIMFKNRGGAMQFKRNNKAVINGQKVKWEVRTVRKNSGNNKGNE